MGEERKEEEEHCHSTESCLVVCVCKLDVVSLRDVAEG